MANLCSGPVTLAPIPLLLSADPRVAQHRCLDTIQDFIGQNNPEGQSTSDWMQQQYFEKLGVEHSRWLPLAGSLLCGFSADTSCRDLARFGQLWANTGEFISEPIVLYALKRPL